MYIRKNLVPFILYFAINAGFIFVFVSCGSNSSSTGELNISNDLGTLSPPTGVSAAAGNGEVTISWNPVTGATAYNSYWSTTASVAKTNGTKISNITSPYKHTGLTNGTTYYYVVTSAVIGATESAESTQVVATPPAILASGLDHPNDITVDSTSVYWVELSDNGAIKKVGLNSGAVTTLASNLKYPVGILVDSTSVFWVDSNNGTWVIKKIDMNGGAITTLASGFATGLDIDSENIYWSEIYTASSTTTGTIKKFNKNDGTVTILATNLKTVFDLAIDTSMVYWCEFDANSNSGTINKMPKTGGSIITLASANQPTAILVDSTNVYWKENLGSVGTGIIKKVGLNGGAVTTLASGLYNPAGIAIDSTNIYWVDAGSDMVSGNGTVNKIGINSGSITTANTT